MLIIVNLILNKIVTNDVIKNKLKENITPMLTYMADPVKAQANGVNLPGAAGPNDNITSIKGCVESVMGMVGMISGNNNTSAPTAGSAPAASTATTTATEPVNEGALFDE